MGNARKQLVFGPTLFPHITCSICHSPEPDTWKHVLLSCTQQHIHALRIKRHNKAVWESCKLLLSYPNTRYYILMNAVNHICPLIIRSPLGYYLVLAAHQDAIITHVSNLTYYVSLAYHINTNLLLLPPPQLLYNSLNSHFAMIAFLLRLLIEKPTNTNPYYKISKHMAGMLPLSWSLLQVQEPHPTSQP
jgi:hypothetical protein